MNQRGFSVSAILVGLLFAALGVAFLLEALDAWELRVDVLFAVAAIGLGAALILEAILRQAR